MEQETAGRVDPLRAANPVDLPRLSEAEQSRFFEASLERASDAETRMGAVTEDISLAGSVIRLVFAGSGLHDIVFPALAHLSVPAGERVDLTLHVWESRLSGVAMVPAPCPSTCFTDRGDIWTMPSRRVRSAYNWLEYSLSLLDLERGEGLCWIRDAGQLPFWSRSAPLRTLLGWWMEHKGAQLLHAAAVGVDGRGLLITGKGGVGKSTTALRCLAAGMDFAGDDYVVVTGGSEPKAFSLYRTAKIVPAAMADFADFSPELCRFGEESKAVIWLPPGKGIVASLRLEALATPVFAPVSQTRFAPAPRARLREAASFTTLSQLPHAGQPTIDFIEGLLDRLPAYAIALGSDPAGVASAVADFIAAPKAAPMVRAPAADLAGAPLVTVVIPVHNGAHFLREAVDSVLAQGLGAIDLVIVDDGSTDDLIDVVPSLPVDARLFRQPNLGPAAARNRGIRDAAGDLIAFLDVDDLWPEGSLAASIAALRDVPGAAVVIGWGQIMECGAGGEWQKVGDPREDFPYRIPAALFRRSAFERVGLFDERLRFGEDTDWFVRAQELGVEIERLDRTAVLVRRHGANMTHGRSGIELTPLRLFKNVLDRRRARSPDE